jgi:glyoxylase-like metal-dependent hydrolase (beta-lactamase superfamily II)
MFDPERRQKRPSRRSLMLNSTCFGRSQAAGCRTGQTRSSAALRTEKRGAVAGIKKAYQRFNNYPLEIVIDGDKAMVSWHIVAANAEGAPIDAKGANLFTIRKGKIAYMANFHDTVPFTHPTLVKPTAPQPVAEPKPAPNVKLQRYEATAAQFFVNAFLIETPNGVVAVDATIANSTARALREKIDKEIRKPLLAVLVTHGHPDHFTGLGELTKGLDVPILATQGAIDFARREDAIKGDVAIAIFGDDYPRKRMFPNKAVAGGTIHTFDGVDFKVEDYGPGESDADALWYFVDADGARHAFIGDIAHNHMHCFFRDGHTHEWIASLHRLTNTFDHDAILYSGHGEPAGTEIVSWHKGYVEAFVGTLHSMLGDRNSLTEKEKAKLVAKMQSYLPNDKLLFLMMYELDETIKLLKERGIV